MSIHLNELKPNKLYNSKNKLIIPLDPSNKFKGSALFLLTPSPEASVNMIRSNPILLNKADWFKSYYMEKSVNVVLNETSHIKYVLENKLKSKDRNKLDDSEFGIPSKRAYPLNDEAHVRAAIRMFNHCSEEDEKELAKNINKKIKEYNMTDIEVGEDNRFSKYYQKPIKEDYSEFGFNKFKGEVTEDYVRFDNNQAMVFEDTTNNTLKRMLYQNRMKNNNEVMEWYNHIKLTMSPRIRITKLNIVDYKSNNLYIDTSFYTNIFKTNNTYTLDKGVTIYNSFMSKILSTRRFRSNGYNVFTVFVDVNDWKEEGKEFTNYMDDINPISTLVRIVRTKGPSALGTWKDLNFIFYGSNGYFTIKPSTLNRSDISKFLNNIRRLRSNENIESDELVKDTPAAITTEIIDQLEKTTGITLYAVGKAGENSGSEKATKAEDVAKKQEEVINNKDKEKLVKQIENVASKSSSVEDAVKQMDEDETIKNIIYDLQNEEQDDIKFSVARQSRINSLGKDFENKQVNGKKVSELIAASKTTGDKVELTSTKLEVNSINKDQWEDIKFINFNADYDIDEDIVAILNFFSTRTVPIAVRTVDVQDTSTTEDFIDTWTVNVEAIDGTRAKLVFDIPKFINNRFLRLRGNDKIFNAQLMNLPVIKTEPSTCQITTNYNKIFFYIFGSNAGKSNVSCDIMLKALDQYKGTRIRTYAGSNALTAIKYEIPIDYRDFGSIYSRIEFAGNKFYFDQDFILEKFGNKIDYTKGFPVGEGPNGIIYYNSSIHKTYSDMLRSYLEADKDFDELLRTVKPSTKYAYSRASILSVDIPVVVICCYCEGLMETLKKAKIEYRITDKRENYDKLTEDCIKFSDAYLYYKVSYESSMFMNGLKDCPTDQYSIKDVNTKSMWVEILDLFGGRIKADGLDNFYDLMIDPLTVRTCEAYNLPTDFCSMLIHASNLMCDTKYNKHTDISGNRLRCNEIIAGYTYKELAKAYAEYRIKLKKLNKASISIKKSAIIDAVLTDPTGSDASTINDLNFAEYANTYSFKGLSGLNSERSYSLDKRCYDESMVGTIGMSTGFAGTVGITRQGVIDPNIMGKRGYIKDNKNIEYKDTKILTISESLTPLSTTHDDPFREAMSNTQRTKHEMRIAGGDPLLLTNGMDDVLTNFTPNYFSFNAKENGKVIEKDAEHILVQYKSGEVDYIPLTNTVYKNSDGGFYTSIQLVPNKKIGTTFKAGDVIAYDPKSYTQNVGYDDSCTYNQGTIAKVAIMTTDEGFEDSCVVDEYLARALSSDVVVQTPINLDPQTNIFNLVKVGQQVQEGDNLLVIQNTFEDNDVNILLKNLVDDEEQVTDIGRIPIKSHCTGKVEDIKVYRTVELSELSDSLKKLCMSYSKEKSKAYNAVAKYDKTKANRYKVSEKQEMTGKLKNVNGVLIEIYISYKDDFSIGDKLIFLGAQKGVSKDVFSFNESPRSSYRPDEPINAMASMCSFDKRMITSSLQYGLAYKFLIELDRQVKDIMGIKHDNSIMHEDLINE